MRCFQTTSVSHVLGKWSNILHSLQLWIKQWTRFRIVILINLASKVHCRVHCRLRVQIKCINVWKSSPEKPIQKKGKGNTSRKALFENSNQVTDEFFQNSNYRNFISIDKNFYRREHHKNHTKGVRISWPKRADNSGPSTRIRFRSKTHLFFSG